jgi:hypothetical protein
MFGHLTMSNACLEESNTRVRVHDLSPSSLRATATEPANPVRPKVFEGIAHVNAITKIGLPRGAT